MNYCFVLRFSGFRSLLVSTALMLFCGAFALGLPAIAHATTYYVATTGHDTNPGTLSSPFLTIQKGVTAAAATGDSVDVAAGTYKGAGNSGIDTLGKAVTVSGTGTPANPTVLVSPSTAESFVVQHNEGQGTVIEGFTFIDGDAGIYVVKGSPAVKNCTFGKTSDTTDTNGIYVTAGSPTITACTFVGASQATDPNTTYGIYLGGGDLTVSTCAFDNESGTGIFGENDTTGTLAVTNSTFTDNAVGVDVYCPSVTVSNTTFTGNSGGALYIDELDKASSVTNCTFTNNDINAINTNGSASPLAITGCTFTNNGPDGQSGAIQVQVTDATISDCSFFGNSCSATGAAIYVGSAAGTIENCTFVGNNSYIDGGAIYFDEATTNVINCSFTNNVCSDGGNAISTNFDCAVNLLNCVMYNDNEGASGTQEIYDDGSGTNTANNCDVEDGTGGGADLGDPLYVNPHAHIPDLHLGAKSPCLTAGVASVKANGVELVAPSLTQDGYTRTLPPSIGAYDSEPAPKLLSFSPASGPVGTIVTITGTGLADTTSIKIGSLACGAVTPLSFTAVAAVIPKGAATATLSLVTPGGSAATTAAFTVTPPPNPVPAISSLAPATVLEGSATTTVTVKGTGLISSSVGYIGTLALSTKYVSAVEVTVTLPAASLVTAGTFDITIKNPAPGGGTSNTAIFTVTNHVPTVKSLSPSSATAGAASLPVTVMGTGFVTTSQASLGTTALSTKYVSAVEVTVTLPAASLVTAGTFDITIKNPAPGGGTSNTAIFTVTNHVPTVKSLSPSSATAGAASLTVTVMGTEFVTTSQASFGTTALKTTFVSATEVKAVIPAAQLKTKGTFPVTVTNPAPGGGKSNAVTFTVNAS